MGQVGAIPISRLAGNSPQLPNSQGYIGTGGSAFRPTPGFLVPAPPLGVAQEPQGYGMQFAPGQGGDTPGGGGNFPGLNVGVATAWYTDGLVTPPAATYNEPGQVGARPSRRSGA
jgi:hypothetical protein